jgi:N-carbamoylputrescine amidase
VHVAASLWEADPAVAPRGWNTQICVAPDGALVARTRKLHIPVTAGYREDRFFPEGDGGYPVVRVGNDTGGAAVGFPTCWDQWFPELARAYALAGADVLVYPTAIGSEPDHPGFDTRPLWERVITANGITNGTFMVAVNRIGTERLGPDAPAITFYGSSFISDPYGRVLVRAPRDEPVALVADLDLDARRDWLELFPFLTTRRPDAYASLIEPRAPGKEP